MVAQTVKRLSTMWETEVRSLGWEDPLEKEMAMQCRRPWRRKWQPTQIAKSRTGLSDFTSLVVQWLRICAPTAEGTGLIPGQGIKIPNAAQCSQKIKLYKYIAIAVTETLNLTMKTLVALKLKRHHLTLTIFLTSVLRFSHS